jgi:GPH family glycoside/pentoside/hexuronide:cation symporter
MTENTSSPLSFGTKVAYAAPAFALAVVGIPVYVYIPKFYTDVVGVPIASMGLILLAVRLFDAITDPAIGLLSDHTKTRFGRRRPYIAIASILVAVSVCALFNPPSWTSATMETIWFTVWIFTLFLCWTLVVVPYESLGPELSFDYHERTSLFALRDGLLIAGTLAAASAPAVIDWLYGLTGSPQDEKKKFFIMSALYAPLIVACCYTCVLWIREMPNPMKQKHVDLKTALQDIAQNRPFVILLISYVISAFGNQLPATLILFYVQYVLKSDYANFFLVLYFFTGVAFLPLWILVSKKIGKKAAWLISMGINTGAFLGVMFLGAGDEVLYGIIVFFSGIGFGASFALPSAIQADVIDYDELISGLRREGLFIGIWSIAKKLAAALGVGISLYLLGFVGYQPNIEQSGAVVLALKLLYGLVPCLCNIIAFMVALLYPISQEKHREIRKLIEERGPESPVKDPLKDRILKSTKDTFNQRGDTQDSMRRTKTYVNHQRR